MEEPSPALQLCQQLQALLEWEQAHPMGEEEEQEQERSPALQLCQQLQALQDWEAAQAAAAAAPTPRKKKNRSASGFRGKTTIPQWSPWSAAGGWSMAGLPWHECGRGVNFTPQINRVRAVLVRDTWAWQLPPDNIAAAPGWFHIKPDNVTEEQARILVNKAGQYSNMDYYALQRNRDERRPEYQQPREPCIWVSHLVYFWNHSRGWCSSPRCQEKFADRGMVFTGEQGLNVGGDNSTSWSLDRTHNDGLHQWWNIAGCVHSGCQNFTNSHPTNGYSAKRLADPDDPPFPQFDVDDVGGPTAYWQDFHGNSPTPPFPTHALPSGPRQRRQKTMLARVKKYMSDNGWEHSPSCRHAGRHCNCAYGIKRTELIEASPAL